MQTEATLTYLQFGVILNVVGIVVALVVSLAIAARYPRPFFRAWTWHYVFGLLAIAAEFVLAPERHQSLWTIPQAACLLLGFHFTCRTAWTLHGQATPRLYWVLLVGVLLMSVGLGAAGLPFETSTLPVLVASVAAHGWLGVSLIRLGNRVSISLGTCVLFAAAWYTSYPLIITTPFSWVGFAGAGLLHVLISIGMALYVLDDTTRQLERQHAELQEVDRLKTNFLATMSHELRTPLTVIKGSGLLLREGTGGDLTETQLGLVDDLCDHTERLIRLINDLLDFSKMEVGAMSYHRQIEDLNGLVRHAVEGMQPVFQRAGLSLTLELPDAPVAAEVDGLKLSQVLVNLLANAQKFTVQGGAHVKLAESGGEVRITVTDTGIGMAPQELGRIFGKFYQVDGGSTRSAGGTGLGLAICKAIVEEGHQGRLTVTSEPGRGSAFTVTLRAASPSLVAA